MAVRKYRRKSLTKKTVLYSVWVSEAWRDEAKRCAKLRGMGCASYVRRAVQFFNEQTQRDSAREPERLVDVYNEIQRRRFDEGK